jgi:hypothetical protein
MIPNTLTMGRSASIVLCVLDASVVVLDVALDFSC